MCLVRGFVSHACETSLVWRWRSSCRTFWLASYIVREGRPISFTKVPLDQVVHPSEYFHSAILLYPMQYYNKTKWMFEPCTRFCYLHLACTSVHYKWKVQGNNYLKVKISMVKNLVCFNFVEVWAIRKKFYTEIFQIYDSNITWLLLVTSFPLLLPVIAWGHVMS